MTRKVRTAIVGLGTVGAIHADWYAQIPESEFVAVCTRRESVLREYERKYGVKGYTDYRDLLENKDVEAITISTPHSLHCQMAVEAAKAGKHVAVEKPLATSLKEADEMVGAVTKYGVKDLYLENLCFAPSYKKAKDLVGDGALGDVYLCKAREAGDFLFGSESERAMINGETQWSWYFDPKMTGGGCLISMGCHPIQYVRHVFNRAPVKRVYAEIMERVGSPKPKGIEDAVLLTMRFNDDRVGSIEASFYADGGQADKAEIYGNRGTILVDLYNRNPITVHSHVGYSFGQSVFVPQGLTKGWTFPIPDELYSLGYYHEQRHFLQSILNDQRPSVNFDDGRATLEIIEAGYRSHRSGTSVNLPLS